MLQNINIDAATVSAEMHGELYHALFSKQSGVLDYGNKLSHTVVSNNLIEINDGIILNQGRLARIPYGSAEEVAIENGQSGVNRKDLIVLRFETDGINESQSIEVLKGANDGTAPTPTTSDIYKGGTAHEMPLYLVTLTGLNITNVETQFEIMSTSDFTEIYTELEKKVDKKVQLTSVDLNTVTEANNYACVSCTNRPVNANGLMQVYAHSTTFLYQRYRTYASNEEYTRTCNNGTWSNWERVGVASVKEITLGTTWSDGVQVVNCTGITANDTPILSVKLSSTQETAEAEQAEWNKIFRADTGSGTITFKAVEDTTMSLTVLVKGV